MFSFSKLLQDFTENVPTILYFPALVELRVIQGYRLIEPHSTFTLHVFQ